MMNCFTEYSAKSKTITLRCCSAVVITEIREKRYMVSWGHRVALSYFVFAQNLMSGDIESTRFGSVIKNDDYSSRISSRERSDAYNNAMEVANAYLQECVAFCREVGLIKVVGKTKLAVGGVTIRKIGV